MILQVLPVVRLPIISLKDASYDLVITDPPFGGILHYSELADFFYVWLRLVLKSLSRGIRPEYTPKTLEAVANRARQPGKDEETGKVTPIFFYQRLLTACYSGSPPHTQAWWHAGFTFHHSEDAPWVSVLESLFDAGFYLQATYPIRSDETKGTGQFGSRMIEYDIIHVCRKRLEEPQPFHGRTEACRCCKMLNLCRSYSNIIRKKVCCCRSAGN
jgi:adenine-specific DNA methylase